MITSLDNKTVKELTKLHQKKYRDGRFLILDPLMIDAALKHNKLQQLVYTGEKPFEFANTLEVSKEVLNKIAKKDGLSYIGVSLSIN